MSDTIVLKLLAVYSLVLTILGTIGNMLVLATCCFTPSLRKVNTFRFFIILSIADTIALYGWNLDHFLIEFSLMNANWQNNLAIVRLTNFLQYLSLQYSAWCLVKVLFYVLKMFGQFWQKTKS
jgi:hypothetical protein